MDRIQLDDSPYSLFIGSIRSPETKKKYLQRMGYFFNYLDIHGANMEECFEILTKAANENAKWLPSVIFRYLQNHKDRVESKEITSTTSLGFESHPLHCSVG